MVYHSSSSLLEAKGKPSPGIPSAKPAEMVTSKADSERMKKEDILIKNKTFTAKIREIPGKISGKGKVSYEIISIENTN